MIKRVIFSDKAIRELFFKEVLISKGFKFWKELQLFSGIPKSRLEFYRNGTFSISFKRFNLLLNCLPKEQKKYFLTQVEFIDAFHGQQKGGKTTSQRYPEIFEKGRRIAWKTKRKSMSTFDIKLNLNQGLCEFMGAFMGDGFTNKYNYSYLIQFTGDSRFDMKYYHHIINPIALKYFGLSPRIYKKNNAMVVNFYSKNLYHFLTKRLMFPKGKKCYTVKIPEEVLNNYSEFLPDLLRGLYDTDGCIFFDKRKTYLKKYPRVHIKLVNKPLIKQIYGILDSLNLNPRITHTGYVIQINGRNYTRKFLRKVGFSNFRHLDRIKANYPELLK